MPRLFISYRSADGADKATALARDLGARFGVDAVFIDKDDLGGGVDWHAAVAAAIGERPVLLLVVTPLLLGAIGPDGRRRIDDADDPVRRELQGALDAGATVLPLLADGVETLPPPATLPPPFDRLAGLTWRRLRAYDWAQDLGRIVADLHAAGVPPAASGRAGVSPAASGGAGVLPAAPGGAGVPVRNAALAPAAMPRQRRRAAASWIAAVAVALAVGAAAGWFAARPPAAAPVAGEWDARLREGEQVPVRITRDGDRLTLEGAPIAVAGRAEWAELGETWQRVTGHALVEVRYRGEGRVEQPPATAPRVAIVIDVLAGGERVDGGALTATLQPDGRLAGRMWWNGEQREVAAELRPRR